MTQPSQPSPQPPQPSPQPQHRVVEGHSIIDQPKVKLTPGPIAIGPTCPEYMVKAVEAGGGEVVPLSSGKAHGLVWLVNDEVEYNKAITQCPKVQWVQLPFAGVDRFVSAMTAAEGPILYTSAKGAYAEPVAEHAVALTLGCLRLLCKRARATRWEDTEMGQSLYGLNVLVVGAGGIAAEYIRLIAPYRCNITVVRNRPLYVEGAQHVVTFEYLHTVLPAADVVVIAAPLTPDTLNMFQLEQFKLMKDTAAIVNVGRGPIINTDALVEALKTNQIAAAGLDVTEPEPLPEGHYLWTDERVLITPHSADTESMCEPLLAARTTANVKAFLSHGQQPFEGIVDLKLGY